MTKPKYANTNYYLYYETYENEFRIITVDGIIDTIKHKSDERYKEYKPILLRFADTDVSNDENLRAHLKKFQNWEPTGWGGEFLPTIARLIKQIVMCGLGIECAFCRRKTLPHISFCRRHQFSNAAICALVSTRHSISRCCDE